MFAGARLPAMTSKPGEMSEVGVLCVTRELTGLLPLTCLHELALEVGDVPTQFSVLGLQPKDVDIIVGGLASGGTRGVGGIGGVYRCRGGWRVFCAR